MKGFRGNLSDLFVLLVGATAWHGGHFESYHGYLIRDGEWSKLVQGRREVLERDRATGYPIRVRVTARNELGRTLSADGWAGVRGLPGTIKRAI